ncbi:MAG: hypothetical protein LAO06_03260 [Acidobacteriia bacterium]|nr:hypothetical protein [Terriglobia bacterium]
MNLLFRLAQAAYTRSPQANLRRLAQKLSPNHAAPMQADRYDPLDDLLQCRSLPALLNLQLKRLPGQSALALAVDDNHALASLAGSKLRIVRWNWQDEVSAAPAENVVVAATPTRPEHWQAITRLKKQNPGRVFTLPELLLPFAQITLLKSKLDYILPSVDDALSYYLGERFFGPLEELNARYSLQGKRVLEFGPLDAFQTAGLVHLGAKVDCIEARPNNAIKTRSAAEAFGWPVRIFLDDFHNADASKYGRYDLAFAHGVYYHSIEPFVFLENLASLADNIFVGGYCADGWPADDSETEVRLEHEGATYRAHPYVEAHSYDAGVNAYGYFFHSDDLAQFFRRKGYAIDVISRLPPTDASGVYFRFLATRSQPAPGGAQV